ncbi:hypothetical protein JXJ21_02045 [candidate division KSB1 bacterium]|nr:hypothetical protein [candidate division KSB1 bacterium]
MGGKASLIMILGFAYIFSIYQSNMGNVTTRSLDNYAEYYSKVIAREIAVSGMNIIAAKIYSDSSWRHEFTVAFQGGWLTIEFGNETDTLEVFSIGRYIDVRDTVIAYFGYTSSGESLLLQYTLYTAHENGLAWTNGDTVWGQLHTNGVLNHKNNSSIVFYGKVSAGKNISGNPKTSKTQFLGGYEVGVYLPEVDNMNRLINAAASGGYVFPAPEDTMKLEFKSTGNVIVYQNGIALHPDPGIALSSLTSNGAIYSAGPVEIQGGSVNTSMTGITVGSGSNVIFKEAIQYSDNPETNPNSDDFIGIVAWNDIIFDNTVKTNWYLQGALMAINGSMSAVVMDKSGIFNYYGSIYQNTRGNAKMFQSFMKKYKHDDRFNENSPPFFPGPLSGTPRLRLLSWWE